MTEPEGQNIGEALSAIVQRAQTDPSYRSQFEDTIGLLRESGLPDSMIAPLLQAAGLEEADVAGYGYSFAAAPVGGGAGTQIIVNTICVGTCRSATIVIDVGCKVSFRG
ncbi:MAG: hypothetical protein HYX51_10385 [Chloroflexi bacterium]|nr:hypothetical protein [Chloroflexota bacterium]